MADSCTWVRQLQEVTHRHSSLRLCEPDSGVVLDLLSAAECAENEGAVAVAGLEVPVRVLRAANEFSFVDFDSVWARGSWLSMGLRLPSVLDLLVTKINTGRHADYEDLLFLEDRVKAMLEQRLPICDAAEAAVLLERYIDPESLRHALVNPWPEVRTLARGHLKRFASKGDPYSAEILQSGWEMELAA
jgi:hypothetical protein